MNHKSINASDLTVCLFSSNRYINDSISPSKQLRQWKFVNILWMLNVQCPSRTPSKWESLDIKIESNFPDSRRPPKARKFSQVRMLEGSPNDRWTKMLQCQPIQNQTARWQRKIHLRFVRHYNETVVPIHAIPSRYPYNFWNKPTGHFFTFIRSLPWVCKRSYQPIGYLSKY